MAEIVRMPLLSDTMKEGVIAAWHKKVGDKVQSDDVIAEVETDKATMEVMPYVDGVLLYASDKKAIPVNGIMVIIGKEGEDISALLNEEGSEKPSAETKEEKPEAKTATTTEAPAAAPQKASAKPDESLATVIQMPLLSDTMKEGKIAAWLKKVGDKVASDDVLAEVETDKATMEVMPYVDGVVLYISDKKAIPVNDVMAIVGKEGTDVQPYLDYYANPGAAAAAEKDTKETGTQAETATPSKEAAAAPAAEASKQDDGGRVKISPLARKMAKDKGINISEVKGTGDGGRIIKSDIENFVPAAKSNATAPKAAASAANGAWEESYKDTDLSQMRRVIAQRLGESKFSAPHFYLTISVKMDKAMDARTEMNKMSESKISFNDLVIKASAMALQKHPAVNSSWMGDFIRENHHIHIGTAVAVPEGLIVPVVKFANHKTLSAIAAESKELVKKAKDKKLQPVEFTGNTFTISNLGMMDIDEFTAIINPPDACILAVGKIEPTPVVEEGEILVRNIMKLTLSCDHRVVDGAVGAAFLQTLKAFLENPVTMLV
ncbi:MAG: pyruvate dehydrogenase complex dihydrolipoamide acetyltransferase [Bacteroidetes bacterium 43-16]|nr:MAG: pyruvate dehydrogenase complex dihydrolipoamide acetyltransferase [Bacteroidetes bacterium 43-16]